jgi:hypothetical protein
LKDDTTTVRAGSVIDLTDTSTTGLGSSVVNDLERQGRRSLFAAAVVIGVGNVGDMLLTQASIRNGASEANPLAKALFGFGLIWLIKAALVVTVLVRNKRARVVTVGRLAGAWFVAGIYSMVVAANLLTYTRGGG